MTELQKPDNIDLMPVAVHAIEGGHVINCELKIDDDVSLSQIKIQDQTREFSIHRDPLGPTELFALMNSIAPMPTDNIGDVRFDLQVGLGKFPDFFESRALQTNHKNHFSEAWAVILSHGERLLHHLPTDNLSYVSPMERTSVSGSRSNRNTITKALGRIGNKEIKADLFQRHKANEVIAWPLTIEESRILLPATPLAEIQLLDGQVEYHTIANIQHVDNEALSGHVRISDEEVGRAVVLNSNRKLTINGTQRRRQGGIVPAMKWSMTDKPSFKFDSPELIRPRLSPEKDEIVSSSLIGAVMLSYLTPEVTEAWPKRAGYTKDSSKQQDMGPLQATLLSVLSSQALMSGSFVDQVESVVRQKGIDI